MSKRRSDGYGTTKFSYKICRSHSQSYITGNTLYLAFQLRKQLGKWMSRSVDVLRFPKTAGVRFVLFSDWVLSSGMTDFNDLEFCTYVYCVKWPMIRHYKEEKVCFNTFRLYRETDISFGSYGMILVNIGCTTQGSFEAMTVLNEA